MARTKALLPDGRRITDYISLGVIASSFPRAKVREILRRTGRDSTRQRDLPAHVVVYYVVALALYMHSSYREVMRCLLEGVGWLTDKTGPPKVVVDSAISQARTRLGWEPMQQLHDEIVRPVATELTRGAWFRGLRVVSLDGSSLDVPDEEDNAREFSRQKSPRGETAFPQIRFVSLVENGTHVLFGSRMGPYDISENELAKEVLPFLAPGMICLADRGFYGFNLWSKAKATGADLLWRTRMKALLPREQILEDGSFLSTIYPSGHDHVRGRGGLTIRVVEYTLEGIEGAEPLYRLATTLMDPKAAPAQELAALYHERWEIEGALDELKTHLRGSHIVLRSKRPDLVKQEFYGLVMAHFAVRALMHEAALSGDVDPDRLSFLHSVRVVRRKMARFASLPPSGVVPVARKRHPGNPGGAGQVEP
jgi:Insertion element 4 transposase N-terminal/Transposase DDE domain